MMKPLNYFITALSALVILGGCRTNPPVETENREEYGRVAVTSQPDSARILVNGVFTGRYTDDTLLLAAGAYSIRVEKDNYAPASMDVTVLKDSVHQVHLMLQQTAAEKIVLLEDFANVSCVPCVTSNLIIEQLVHHKYGGKLIAVKYPTNFPSPNDPFYNANKPDADARISYYRVLSAPTIFIDGVEKPAATDSNAIKGKVEQRLNEVPKYGLSVTKSVTGALLNITAEVSFIDQSADLTDLVLHAVVIESKIEFAAPPGSNGETKFYNVLRKMLPGSGGTALAGTTDKTVPLTVNLQTQIASSWNASEINVVVFIQNTRTKEILQAASTI